jgi:DNA-binding IclR family transcriptional regulator
MSSNREKILQTLPFFGEVGLQDILAATGLPYGTVRGNLRDMRKAGLAIHTGTGWRKPYATQG